MLTKEELDSILEYRKDGNFYWLKVKPKSSVKCGDLAGTITQTGRRQLTINGVRYYAHQLTYLHNFGYIPKQSIKHINGNQLDNRIDNLTCTTSVSFDILDKGFLESLFDYDQSTGLFRRKSFIQGNTKIGDIAGHVHSRSGYVRILINRKSCLAHRLAWTIVTGEILPASVEIDHINGVRADNRFSNLRKATRNQNQHNAKLREDNKSGVKGMRINGNCIECRVAVNGTTKYKTFALADRAEAEQWLMDTRTALHKEFTNHGT